MCVSHHGFGPFTPLFAAFSCSYALIRGPRSPRVRGVYFTLPVQEAHRMSKYPQKAQSAGVSEDRSIEQFTARIEYHPPGEGGHAYLAQVLSQVRADSLDDLREFVAEQVEYWRRVAREAS